MQVEIPDEPEKRAEAIRVLEAALGQLKSLPHYEMPVEVTVCMPAGPWALKWAWRALESVLPEQQGMPLIVHACAQASALAEASALENGKDGWIQSGFKGYEYVRTIPDTGNRLRNICESRKVLAESVQTPYLFFLDADVRCPLNGIRMLVDQMKANPKLAMLGIPYAFNVDHVQLGCTLLRTDAIKDWTWGHDERCECHALGVWLKGQGFDVDHAKGVTAEHRG